jgi:hypothetical protein
MRIALSVATMRCPTAEAGEGPFTERLRAVR